MFELAEIAPVRWPRPGQSFPGIIGYPGVAQLASLLRLNEPGNVGVDTLANEKRPGTDLHALHFPRINQLVDLTA
ncbi:hypothetical protein [Mycobacterium sp. E2327]|uniref:hypothetical protein n=1 Tax=Mycobacterium sp. E2327 TaxID=1834132 RepID=UPI000A9E1576|nr:hypothetical protein [Mycobacterium sp. E2327]